MKNSLFWRANSYHHNLDRYLYFWRQFYTNSLFTHFIVCSHLIVLQSHILPHNLSSIDNNIIYVFSHYSVEWLTTQFFQLNLCARKKLSTKSSYRYRSRLRLKWEQINKFNANRRQFYFSFEFDFKVIALILIMKLLVLLISFVAIAQCEYFIPAELKNAKNIEEHPQMEATLKANFPQYYNSEVGKTPFIIGGNNAGLGQIPHQALLYIQVNQNAVYICGGSLIKRNWVMTVSWKWKNSVKI